MSRKGVLWAGGAAAMGQLAACLGDKDESCDAALVGSTNIYLVSLLFNTL